MVSWMKFSSCMLKTPNLKCNLVLLLALPLAFFVGLCSGDTDPRAKTTFCKHVYVLQSGHNLCSTKELSAGEVSNVNQQFKTSFELLETFASQKGYGVPEYTIPLDIYVVPYAMMNKSKIFGDKFAGQDVLARYYEGKGYVFITHEEGLKPSSTDLPHELAHYANDNLGITNELLDERLAREFERFYRLHAR